MIHDAHSCVLVICSSHTKNNRHTLIQQAQLKVVKEYGRSGAGVSK